jgi:hypothetical protein
MWQSLGLGCCCDCQFPRSFLPMDGQVQVQRLTEIPLCLPQSLADRVHAEGGTHNGVRSVILSHNLRLHVFQFQCQATHTQLIDRSGLLIVLQVLGSGSTIVEPFRRRSSPDIASWIGCENSSRGSGSTWRARIMSWSLKRGPLHLRNRWVFHSDGGLSCYPRKDVIQFM